MKERAFTSAVILAAGSGTRFGTENGTKQNIPLLGVPAVARAALAFEKCSSIDEIILVGKKDELETLRGYVKDFGISKVTHVVEGGTYRAESSFKGVSRVDPRCEFVAIHDGARCLVTSDIIERCVTDAVRFGAAAAAEKVTDTVKKADSDGFIEATVDREYVWLVKTPQVFSVDIYRKSAEAAVSLGAEITDDCMMAERLGFRIKLTDCGKNNIKLTTKDDLGLAEYILSERQSEGEI